MPSLSAEAFVSKPPQRLGPLYVIHGAEPLTALEAADVLRECVRKAGYLEREVFSVEAGFDWQRLLQAGGALSLFASQRFFELRIPNGKPGREGGPAIEAFCRQLPADTITLVQLPELDWTAKKTAWFTALEAAGVMIEAQPVGRADMPAWLAGRLSRQQQSANAEALAFLADRVEGNLLAAQQEISKLALLCPPGNITLEHLKATVMNVSRFNPFSLAAVIHERNTEGKAARIWNIVEGLKAEGEAQPLVLWALVNELRLMARLRGFTQAGRAPHPGKAREIEHTARQHSAAGLAALNVQAARIDRIIKGLDSGDAWQALAQLACALGGIRLMKGAA